MYRPSGAGKPPTPPALLATAMILQAYTAVSDAEAVELTIVDLRWQIVLDRLGSTVPAFAQSTLRDFRARLSRAGMMTRLWERIAHIAEETGAFDPRRLPALRAEPAESIRATRDGDACS